MLKRATGLQKKMSLKDSLDWASADAGQGELCKIKAPRRGPFN